MANYQSYTVRKVRGTIIELCSHFRIVTADLALKRFMRGWPIEDAICKPSGQKVGRKPRIQTS